MEIEVKQVEGSTFVGRGESGHWTVMDAAEEVDGHDGATRPMEMLLISLGGCTGIDLNTLLNKMRVDYDDIEMTISGDRNDDHPKYYTEIHVAYRIYGADLPEDKVAKAVRLTQEKYCSVTHSLEAEVSYDYEIVSPE
ncbi:MAG: OsmC family protein [Candidatus Bipolaricaulota bacterium]|nr:OsmC family protein [Candidatus Bipolaricaulota bacterium]MBS3791978.1 OsmC family protein [Candidatus Bipolaricaulota bacterium]